MYAQKKPCCAKCADNTLGDWEWLAPLLSTAASAGNIVVNTDLQRQALHTQQDQARELQAAQQAAIDRAIQQMTPPTPITGVPVYNNAAPPQPQQATIGGMPLNYVVWGGAGLLALVAVMSLVRR